MKISLDQLEKSDKRFYASKGQKIRTLIDAEEVLSTADEPISPELIKNNIIGDKANLTKRREMIMASGHEPVDFAYERAIGKNDSVYSNFIELIFEAKKKVGRVVVKNGLEIAGYATGFMVSENLLLTNWHVFKMEQDVNTSVIQFNYELDRVGNPSKSISFNLSPATFFYSFKDLDYCLVAIEPTDISGKFGLEDIGYIQIDPSLGKLGDEDVELLNIIHHPGGDYKQLSIRENKFTKILPTTLWYESDTAQGSSGSPVFNDQWQIVALHHMGVAKKDDHGNYLDKFGNIIPVVDNQIDISNIHWIANEGIRISVIRNHLQLMFPNSPIISKLINPPALSNNSVVNNITDDAEQTNQTPIAMKNSVNISIPSDLINNQKTINVNITSKDVFGAQKIEGSRIQPANLLSTDMDDETLKLERSMDYSACRGYRSDFLGDDFRVPIPKPLSSVSNYIARILNSRAYILKYYKFSVIFNDFKKMPFISAINVDGDEDKRKDETKRVDDWIRDTRIELDCQLNDKFYAKSGFDRGHLSRREDANWGDDKYEAKRNADLTCVHTNACPQVPELNRSNRSGLWGKLEKIVLEKGAIKENGKTGKISVFSGPVFKDSDPIYKGVKIPMEFYKVILWKTDANKLKATAFKLSQSELVEEIDFEELGIDQDVKFKEYQCSIEELQKQTQIAFDDIVKFDTFKGPKVGIEIKNEKQLLEIVTK